MNHDDSHLPLIERIPSANVASPSELRPRDPKDVRWYKPTVGETLTMMGWRWLYFLPAIGLILIPVISPTFLWMFQFTFLYGKLLIVAIGVPMGVFIKAAKNGVRMRKEPFCIHCGYELTNLPDNYICPECGEPYTFRVIDEYRRDPHWFIERYKRRGEVPVADVPFEARKSSKKKSRDGT
ncbi:MAG TPA: zinc ribbon domain-containing protein [Tepidisphaeraceae bacterium]|jgi:predicted RNA-binding Zn-ribbon protein involved in translation (DUF1610 family)|nr:zinc ribbon domain-containing protein [Tepidisphaeraceae bacterium]